MRGKQPVLILGVGNLLRSDDGFGVHVVRELESEGGIPGAKIVDAGVAVMDMLPLVEQARRVIVVDAVSGNREPGTIYSFTAKRIGESTPFFSVHSVGLLQAIFLFHKDAEIPSIEVVGVEPACLDYGLELSPQAQKALPSVAAILRQMAA